MIALQNVGSVITAIGGLGTAAFGLVETSKAAFKGINRMGFKGISAAVTALTPADTAAMPASAMPRKKVLATLEANWINGTDLASQKSIAKSLIKLNLNAGNAAAVAAATGVDPGVLTAVATSIAAGTPLSPAESDVFARFDLIVTALLDETYQCSDQVYRNQIRALATVVSVLLAIAGGVLLHISGESTAPNTLSWPVDMAESVLVGLLATPLAPIAKDLSTALATAVNTMQLVKK